MELKLIEEFACKGRDGFTPRAILLRVYLR